MFCYPGHIHLAAGDQAEALDAVSRKLGQTLDLWADHGLEARIVSGGSTPTCFQSHLVPEYTEIRPGTYIYNDMNNVRGGYCGLEDCAARDHQHGDQHGGARPGRASTPAPRRSPATVVVRPPTAATATSSNFPTPSITKLTEEHAQVDIRACRHVPELGERLTVIPNHICPCVNLQDSVWWRGDDGQLVELVVDARGLLV